MENLFQEECTLSKDSVERYGIAMKKHAQEWVAEIEQMFMDSLFLWQSISTMKNQMRNTSIWLRFSKIYMLK